MRLYLIGPITGKPEDNRRAFENARKTLEDNGYQVDIPHDYTNIGEDWQFCMRRSITAMLGINHKGVAHYDGVAMLMGWRRSKGAKIEHDLAEALGIPCKPWREWLNPAANAAAYADQPVAALAC